MKNSKKKKIRPVYSFSELRKRKKVEDQKDSSTKIEKKKPKSESWFPISNELLMPVRKVKGGYRWGSKGKVYPTKAQAEKQGRAAYASGKKKKKRWIKDLKI